MDELDDTELRRRIPSPSGLSFEDTIMRARFPVRDIEDEDAPPPPPLDLYAFRLSGADTVIVLDRPAIVGRNPAPSLTASGAPPRLVRIVSPRQEVSSSHVEVRQHGRVVVVTDLRSTNGSFVIVPGQEARALVNGESIAVTPGTLVDIGDGNVIEILTLSQVD
jgi:pSer/pThr/pTyr-binding forkhead associated (FHA) protein